MSTSVSDPPPQHPVERDPTSGTSTKGDRLARRDRTIKRWVTIVTALILICVLGLLIRLQGYVSGVEFTPSHFQLRRFSFLEIPFFHLQITPIRRTGQTPATANYLRLNSLISTPSTAPATWHLVSISRGLTGSTPADAQLLTSQLALEIGGDDYWRTWSIDHPQHAKVLWPIVQELALRELYILMPPLFEMAQLDQSPGELKARIDARLVREYVSLIQDLRSSDRHELAEQLLAEVMEDYPDDANLLELRSSIPN